MSEAREIVINASIFLFLTATCVALVVGRHQQMILKIFVSLHYYLSVSAVITFAIFIVKGLSIQQLPVLASLYEMVEYAIFDPVRPLSNHVLAFPFTVFWGTADLLGTSFPRFVGIYREPGMAQIFFITALLLTYFIPVKHAQRKRFFLLCGCLLLFSAAGIINLAFAIVVYTVTNSSLRRTLVSVIRSPLSVVILLATFLFLTHLAVKMTTQKLNNVSGETRIESFKNGLEKLIDHPIFGVGYYNAFSKDNEGAIVLESNIGLVGVGFQIGIVGILLYFMCWAVSLSLLANRRAIVLYVPCLLTLLFSQPSYNDAFVWFLLLLDTRAFTNDISKNAGSNSSSKGLAYKSNDS